MGSFIILMQSFVSETKDGAEGKLELSKNKVFSGGKEVHSILEETGSEDSRCSISFVVKKLRGALLVMAEMKIQQSGGLLLGNLAVARCDV